MRIGHYAPDIWARGGIATYVRRLGQAQTRAGHEVYYLSKTPGAPDESEPSVVVASDADLFRQARTLRFDVLHLHKPVGELPRDRVLTVRTMHGNQGSCPTGSRYLDRIGKPCDRSYSVAGCLWGLFVDRCGSRRPSNVQASFRSIHQEMRLASELHTFTVSTFLKEQMVRAGCPADRVHALASPAPGVNEVFAPPPREGTPRFVFLGRLVPQKGLYWLLRAAARVETAIHLDIAGEGYIRQDLQRLSDRLGLSGRVTFHDWLDPQDVERLIKAARAVVVPSVWHEPAGLTTLEAAALGRPVIASRVGGIPEYAGEEFALLVPPNDVEGLKACITRLAEDDALAEQMGRNGMQAARTRFSMKRFIQKLDGLYALAASGQPGVVAAPV